MKVQPKWKIGNRGFFFQFGEVGELAIIHKKIYGTCQKEK